jgi:molybdopterin-containing oxidoreductase family iron-sulfur binding subunit
MGNKHNKVWVGVEELTDDPVYQDLAKQEFYELPMVDQLSEEKTLEVETSRRDFLKYLGFGLGAATIAASCEIPVRKAIPYVVKPDEIVPGVATYYATTFVKGGDYCAVLVKTREGRPIKIEGNSLSPVTYGGTSARAQASVLSLYNTSRVDGPYRIKDGKLDRERRGKGPSWEEIDREIGGRLRPESRIRIVSNTIMSPMTKRAIDEFRAKFPNTELVQYDPISASALLEANQQCFGQAVVPNYRFDQARVIVSFDADFLGTWISPIEYANQYTTNRKVDPKNPRKSRHIQVESHMTLTGSNADNRILVKPSEQGAAIATLYNEIARLTGGATISAPRLNEEKTAHFRKVAQELVAARGTSLVVSGSNNIGEQVLANAINNQLGNIGTTVRFNNVSLQRQGRDSGIRRLAQQMNRGEVDVLMVLDGANPAWDLPPSDRFQEGMKKVRTKIAFSSIPNETTLLCDYVTPTHNFLESWGDVEPKRGLFSLIQPTISPLFKTRQTEETLLRWAASPNLNTRSGQPMYDYLRRGWETGMFPLQGEFTNFQTFWDSTLHDGVFQIPEEAKSFDFTADINAAAARVRKPAGGDELEISFYETVQAGAGQYADNPWLMELPDPVTRCSWTNTLNIPVSWDGGSDYVTMNNLNRQEGKGVADIVEIDLRGNKDQITVFRKFGQMQNTVSLALGYGREVAGYKSDAEGRKIGINAYPWLVVDDEGQTQYYAEKVSISGSKGQDRYFACVQYHHTMGVTGKSPDSNETINVDEKVLMTLPDPFNKNGFQGGLTKRSVIFQGQLSELKELEAYVHERREEAQHLNDQTLYPYDRYLKDVYGQGHHWLMHIDLNACIGCGACAVACTVENNVPVVGKTEVGRHHEMHWLRIDRYFYGELENPNVVYQPMLCQHCDNAPCENVCPVAATPHNSEGLNQMAYNRCIGTRYCANNCPYKVRRFNWLDFTTADTFGWNDNYTEDPVLTTEDGITFYADNLTRMVLNPDVTVRSRGVMEKCSFCVQRIQEGKLTAKRENRRLVDADVRTACQTACPTGAIVFGDRNDPNGDVRKLMDNPLNYLVLEEINTQSSVLYGAKVGNRNEELVG